MNPPDSTLADPQRIIADLQRKLTEAQAERDAALAQQTATAEVIEVINASPGNLAPVFDAMLEAAVRLCDFAFAVLWIYDGAIFRAQATHAAPPAYADFLARRPAPVTAGSAFALILSGTDIAHFDDVAEEGPIAPYGPGHPLVALAGARTYLAVALRREGRLLGVISAFRQEVRPFTDKQIAFLQSFAAQAVIAIENARLITETREALEQQTATAEVLGVINSSPGDLSPVFDAMLERATRLCAADFSIWFTYDGDCLHAPAIRGATPEYSDFLRSHPLRPSQQNMHGRMIAGEPFVQITDVAAITGDGARDPMVRAFVDLGQGRTVLAVALRKDGEFLGEIAVYRHEVRPFTDKQIALLENFAAQAVIAMENARLITETREALEQQTATSEVLQVINSSPGDLAPVFDAILEKAHAVCGAATGSLQIYDGESMRAVATRGLPDRYANLLRERRQSGRISRMRAAFLQGVPYFQISDLSDAVLTGGDPGLATAYEITGVRTLLDVPLRKDGELLGVIAAGRLEVRPFTEKQIALLQNFAAQAVIAMENARLITETREALEQQTATAEVLGVINSSPGDLAPVFDAMLEKAMRLCEAAFGQSFHTSAIRGVPPAYAEYRRNNPPNYGPGTGPARMLAGERIVHHLDMMDEEAYRRGEQNRRALVDLGGARSAINVALVKDRTFLGFITLFRQEVRPFSDKQIALLENFAAQAVIAIENARLITETREALEQQTATAEVLGVINSSPGDLAPVFDAILEKAHNLCGAAYGSLQLYDGEQFRAVAVHGLSKALADRLRQGYIPGPNLPVSRLLDGERFAHVADLGNIDDPLAHSIVELGDTRTVLWVALRSDQKLLGAIAAARLEVRPFSEKEIALLDSFAAQAVIAMENARLLGELRERTDDLQESLEYQTATSDVLKVISRTDAKLEAVLDTLVRTAARICAADQGAIHQLRDGLHCVAASCGTTPDYRDYVARNPIKPGRNTAIGRMALERRVIHIKDALNDPEYAPNEFQRLGRFRTMLAVPLLREDVVIGSILLTRTRVEPFTERQIELVRTFADQAVIAIENVRLLDEIRQRQAELRVTFDNMADGVVMFDEELRLAAWNRNFQELLDLPDAVLTERPSYGDYLRILAERGEFGTDDIEAELRRRLENADQELRLERTRPNGQVIEVRRNAVPDGGFVLIYSDITERKRSEAEIRAARDTAEATLRDLRAAQANLVQAEKMASLGQLTAGIAHEIKNPLNFVNNFANLSVELLDELKETTAPAVATLDDNKRAEVDETIELLTGNLEKIAEHGRRADGIVKSMLEHSRGSSGERREVDLNGLIEEALNLAYHGARAQDQSFNITLERDFAQGIAPIELVPQDITRVCLNLFGNGFYAANKRTRSNGDGSFHPILAVATREAEDAIEIRIRDNGTGIAPEIKDKLFQPFFTTKPTGEGTGLGLSISYDIVTQQHRGTITVESKVGEFTEFTIRLPRSFQAGVAA